MTSIDKVRELAMTFEEVEEKSHFEKTSFRVRNKIFATLDIKKEELVLKFTLEEQAIFSMHKEGGIFPVPGGWGRKGWTKIELGKVSEEVSTEALRTAYCIVAPKKLAEKYSVDS